MAKALYDDGTYMVTTTLVSTPHRFYPLAHTTASIRRDPLWAAVSFTAFSGACIGLYGDLLFFQEQVALFVLCAGAIVAGRSVAVLRISTLGHSRTMIIGRAHRMRGLYQAIRNARSGELAPASALERDVMETRIE